MQKTIPVCLLGLVIGSLLAASTHSLAQTSSWTDKTPMPTSRFWIGGCVLDSKIYVTGGAVSMTDATSAVEVYDPAQDTWMNKASLPEPLAAPATCAYGGKVYVFGGVSPESSPAATRHVYAYDPQSDLWTHKADMPNAVAWCGIAVVESTIYLLGGFSQFCSSPVRTVMAYDPATDTWTRKADMPLGRFGLSACVAGEKSMPWAVAPPVMEMLHSSGWKCMIPRPIPGRARPTC